MIIGIGTDLTDIDRMRTLLREKTGGRFLERILTVAERELADTRRGRMAEFAAGRFAAKEAVVKALGCGIGKQVGFQDVEILPDQAGKPVCHLSSAAYDRLALPESVNIMVSISHTKTMAVAFATVEYVERT